MTHDDTQGPPGEAPWEVVRGLVEEALDHAPAEREAFLRGRAPSEAALAEALELIAHADDEPGGEGPHLCLDGVEVACEEAEPRAADSASPRPALVPKRPCRLGPWELRRRIGRGGMADVWLAVRADGLYQRKVAIKRLHPGLASGETVARFERERQILASLSHPGIAKMLDAGADDDGVPYIVMEHVAGSHVDAYADERRLSLRARMALVADVAEAVQAAHRMHVVHRDIKPSNVVVDADGRPVLLDFGVAKVLDPEKDASAHVTRDVAGFLTMSYASPEQAAGREPGPTSDVYSLGALAFELATGSPPLHIAGRSTFDALERITLEAAPSLRDALRRRDDAARVAEARGVSARALETALTDRGLDAVLGAALRKEPARRPPDAGALAAELRRWLDGRPVLSSPDGWTRRAARLVRRNRLVFGLIAALVLALSGGLVLVAQEARRARRASVGYAEQSRIAEQQLDKTNAALQVLLRQTIDSLSGLPGTERALDRLVRAGMDLAADQDDPKLQLMLAQTRIDVGVLRAKKEGASATSVARMVDSLRVIDGLTGAAGVGVFPPLPHLRVAVARQQERLGSFEASRATLEAAMEDVARIRPTNPGERLIALSAEMDVVAQYAGLLSRTGSLVRAREEIERVLSLLEGFRREAAWLRPVEPGAPVPELPADYGVRGRFDRGAILENEARLGTLLRRIKKRRASADVERDALRTIGAPSLHGGNSMVGTSRRWVALGAIERLCDAGRVDDARALLAQHVPDWRAEADGLERKGHSELEATLATLETVCRVRRAEGADALDVERLFDRALDTFEDSFPATFENRLTIARASLFRGRTLDADGDRVGAALRYSDAAATLARLVKDTPSAFDVACERAFAETQLARALEGTPALEPRLAHVRAAERALGAFEGDALAAERMAPIRADARALLGE
ncbi:MAG: serine/threonine-protein kinase [Planctomycetota bacterium]